MEPCRKNVGGDSRLNLAAGYELEERSKFAEKCIYVSCTDPFIRKIQVPCQLAVFFKYDE
jgi:hypothetical protein